MKIWQTIVNAVLGKEPAKGKEVGTGGGVPRAFKEPPTGMVKIGYGFKSLFERAFSWDYGIQVKDVKGLKALTAVSVDPVDVFNEINDVVTDLNMRDIFEAKDKAGELTPQGKGRILEKLKFDNLSNEQLLRLKNNLEALRSRGFHNAIKQLQWDEADEKVSKLLQLQLDLLSGLESWVRKALSEFEVNVAERQLVGSSKLVKKLKDALKSNSLKPICFRSEIDTQKYLGSLRLVPVGTQSQYVTVKISVGEDEKEFEVSQAFVKDADRGEYYLQNKDGSYTKLDFSNTDRQKESYQKMLFHFGYNLRENEKSDDNRRAAARLREFTTWANQGLDGLPTEPAGHQLNELIRKQKQPENKAFDDNLEAQIKDLEDLALNGVSIQRSVKDLMPISLKELEVESKGPKEKIKEAKERFLKNLKNSDHSLTPYEVKESLKSAIHASLLGSVPEEVVKAVDENVDKALKYIEIPKLPPQSQPLQLILDQERLRESPFYADNTKGDQQQGVIYQFPDVSMLTEGKGTKIQKFFTKDYDGKGKVRYHLKADFETNPPFVSTPDLNSLSIMAPTPMHPNRSQYRQSLQLDWSDDNLKLSLNAKASNLSFQIYEEPKKA